MSDAFSCLENISCKWNNQPKVVPLVGKVTLRMGCIQKL